MSAINSVGSALYNVFVKNPVEYWGGKDTEEMSAGQLVKATASTYAEGVVLVPKYFLGITGCINAPDEKPSANSKITADFPYSADLNKDGRVEVELTATVTTNGKVSDVDGGEIAWQIEHINAQGEKVVEPKYGKKVTYTWTKPAGYDWGGPNDNKETFNVSAFLGDPDGKDPIYDGHKIEVWETGCTDKPIINEQTGPGIDSNGDGEYGGPGDQDYVVQFSDNSIRWQLLATECSETLPPESIELTDTNPGLAELTWDFNSTPPQLVAEIKGATNAELSNYPVDIIGTNGTIETTFYVPPVKEVGISQTQATAGIPTTLSLNYTPSGVISEFVWYFQRAEDPAPTWIGTGELVQWTPEEPPLGQNPQQVNVWVEFTPWYNMLEKVENPAFNVYPGQDSCNDGPTWASVSNADPSSIYQYSDTTVNYGVEGINECGSFEDIQVTIDNLPALQDAGVFTWNYVPETGELVLSAQYYGRPTDPTGYFHVVMTGTNGTTYLNLYPPVIQPLNIVQDQVNAGQPVTINLNNAPSGAPNYKWIVDGHTEQDGPIPFLTYTFPDPGLESPQLVDVEVEITTWFGEIETIDKQIKVYAGQSGCTELPSYNGYTPATPAHILQYCDTTAITTVSGINQCDEFLSDGTVFIDIANLAYLSGGGSFSTLYYQETGNFDLIQQYFGRPGDPTGPFNLQMQGINGTRTLDLYPPIIDQTKIVQEMVYAGGNPPAHFNLNTLLSNCGASEFKWYIEGNFAGSGETLDYPFPVPDEIPQPVEVRVEFLPWNGGLASVSKVVNLYPAPQGK